MNAERWERLGQVLEGALAVPAADRAAFVDRTVSDDPELRNELISLLEASAGADEYLSHLQEDVLGSDARGALEEVLDGGEPFDPWIGRTVSQYRILDRLGGGGMGVVYRAQDIRLGRQVALKFIAPEIGRDPKARRRFLHEARAASSLDHPNICTIHEIAESEDGRLFIVMAAYDGETLRTRIDRGPAPVDEALGIAEQVARALAAAHERGIVHRDVKPGNVFVTDDGLVKLLDFGLARSPDAAMTGKETVQGTVAYMSPEQARGRRADERSDAWALGVILFEILAGVRPFVGEDPRATLDLILTAEPDLRLMGRELPVGITDLVRRALSKERRERVADGRAFLDALEKCRAAARPADPAAPALAGSGRAAASGAAPRQTGGARRRRTVLVVGGAVAFFAVAGMWRWGGLAGTAPPSVAVLSFAPAAPDAGDRGGEPAEEFGGEPTDGLGGDAGVFGGELAEALRANLALVPRLKAVTAPRAFSSGDAPSVGRRLRVAAVVDGAVRRRGERIVATVRLVDVRTGASRWTGSFERSAVDEQVVLDELAFAIADSLRLHIAPFEPNEYTSNERAYDRFLQGVHSQRKYTSEDIWAALQFYREAYEEDPSFALAHAIAGNAYIALTHLGLAPDVGLARAREHVDRSLALDSTLAEGHAALGFLRIWADRDFEAGERSLRRAIMLYPTLPQARSWYGWYALRMRGWPETAVASLRKALEVDPLNTARSRSVEWVLYMARRYDDVLEQHEVTRSLDADVAASFSTSPLAEAYRELGRFEDAIAEFQAVQERVGGAPDPGLAITYARMGRERDARAILREIRQRAEETGGSPIAVASIYANLGEFDRAFRWLDRTREQDPEALRSLVDPVFDPVRGDPRYPTLLRELGLPSCLARLTGDPGCPDPEDRTEAGADPGLSRSVSAQAARPEKEPR